MNSYPMIETCRLRQQVDPPPINLEAEGLTHHEEGWVTNSIPPTDLGIEGVLNLGFGAPDNDKVRALGLNLDD